MDHIYLDHNSTTPIDPAVAQVISDCYQQGFVNPASQHRLGQLARTRLEAGRTVIAKILGAECSGMSTDSLVFTSGGTESNHLGIAGLALGLADQTKRILISAVEHPSVFGVAEYLKTLGFQVETIPVDQNGVSQLDALREKLQQPATLVSIMLANNETGVLQPVFEAAKICRDAGVLIHTDAVQVVGKMPVDFGQLGVDAMSFTAHKFHGPRGIGGLLVRHGVTVQPQLFGGFQQMAVRPGTEDVALAAGMEHALVQFEQNAESRYEHLRSLRDQLLDYLTAKIPNIVVNGGMAEKTPQTLNISLPGVDRQAFLLAADMNGLAISTGSACASGSSEPSPVLIAMGAAEESVLGALRISVGLTNTSAEVAAAGETMVRIYQRLAG